MRPLWKQIKNWCLRQHYFLSLLNGFCVQINRVNICISFLIRVYSKNNINEQSECFNGKTLTFGFCHRRGIQRCAGTGLFYHNDSWLFIFIFHYQFWFNHSPIPPPTPIFTSHFYVTEPPIAGLAASRWWGPRMRKLMSQRWQPLKSDYGDLKQKCPPNVVVLAPHKRH